MFAGSSSRSPLLVSPLTERTNAIRPFSPGKLPFTGPGTAATTTATSAAPTSALMSRT
jgi:hypothetical protein